MSGDDYWTLRSWIEHQQEVRELERRLRLSEHDLVSERLDHVREVMENRDETNQIHFHQLNENAKQTIEERGHFVSREMFDPFRDQVLQYMHAERGKQKGSSNVVAWVVSAAGVLFGLIGIFLAIWTRLASAP